MSGAYVAKPATVTTPAVPPGWNPDWPFPGPWPPGYTPVLTFGIDSGTFYVPESEHAAEATLFDQVTYETAEPEGTVRWTASINGEVRNLKFSGGESFELSVSSSYASIGNFWGASPTLVFEVGVNDIGETLVLTADSVPFDGFTVVETHSITVVFTAQISAVLTQVLNLGGGGIQHYVIRGRIAADNGASEVEVGQAWLNYHLSSGGWQAYLDNDAGGITVTNPDVLPNKSTFTVEEFILDTYKVTASCLRSADNASSVDLVLTMTINGVDTVYTKTQLWPIKTIGLREDEDWLTINGETGEVTVVNP